MEEVRLYPLSAAQKLHFYTLKYCPQKQVLNIGTSLTIKEAIDFEVLRKAIYEAYNRCEAMRVQFTEEKEGEIFQYIIPKEERPIEYVDFTQWSEEAVEAHLLKWTAIPFERVHSPLSRIVMMTTPDGYSGLYFKVDHMIMDSYAIITFLSDVIEIYCALQYDMSYPKPMQSYIKALEKDLKYEADSKSKKQDAIYWHQLYAQSEPIFTDITGTKLEEERIEKNNPQLRSAKIVSRNVTACHKVYHLEQEPTARLLRFCEETSLPMVCLLMMGLRTYLSKMNRNEEDISIKTTVSRRGTVLEKKSGGTRIHFFPCRTSIQEYMSFLEGIATIQQKQNEIFKHANYDPIALTREYSELYGNEPGASYESMSLTYQPLSLRSQDERLRHINYKCKWHGNGVAACPLYLTVMHNPIDEGLDFYFEYQTGAVTEQELEYLYYYLCKIIFLGVAHPQMSVGEIIRSV